jgi:hypothetical protein
VAATGGGRGKKVAPWGCLFYSRQRRLAIGDTSCGRGRQSGGETREAERRQPWSERSWHGGAIVQTVRLTSEARAFSDFSRIIQTSSNLEIEH